MWFCLKNATLPVNGEKSNSFWLKTKLRSHSKRQPKRMAKYLEGLNRKPRQVRLTPGLMTTLLAKIGADVVTEFVKREFQTYKDGRGWLRVSCPELDKDEEWWGRPAFPTKCLWDDFAVDHPIDDITASLARAT